MMCPNCRSLQVKPGRGPVESGGRLYWPRTCEACGYTWSELRALPEPVRVIAPEPPGSLQGVPPPAPLPGPIDPSGFLGVIESPRIPGVISGYTTAEPPPALPARARTVEPCDPEKLERGELVEFEHRGGLAEGRVVSNKRKARTLQIDADGRPDLRVEKRRIRGRVRYG